MKTLTRLSVGFEDSSALYAGLDVGRRFGDEQRTGVRANTGFRNQGSGPAASNGPERREA